MSPYEILGLNQTATKDEIKKAYRFLAKKCHPDVGGNAETFSSIQQAYSILSDDTLRTEYDSSNKMTGNIFTNVFITLEECYVGTTRNIFLGGNDVEIKIPQGIVDGFRLRFSYGEATVYVKVNITKHTLYERLDNNLHYMLEIDYIDAIIGCEKNMTHISGETLYITIPENVNADMITVIPNKGINQGDLYISLKIVSPILNQEQFEIIKNIKNIC